MDHPRFSAAFGVSEYLYVTSSEKYPDVHPSQAVGQWLCDLQGSGKIADTMIAELRNHLPSTDQGFFTSGTLDDAVHSFAMNLLVAPANISTAQLRELMATLKTS